MVYFFLCLQVGGTSYTHKRFRLGKKITKAKQMQRELFSFHLLPYFLSWIPH